MTSDWDSGVETNRESTETEVVATTNEVVNKSQQQEVEDISSEQKLAEDVSQISSNIASSNNVPENGEIAGTESNGNSTTASSDPSAVSAQEQTSTSPNATDGMMTNGHQEHITAVGGKSSGNNNNTTELDGGKCSSVGIQDGAVQEGTQ